MSERADPKSPAPKDRELYDDRDSEHAEGPTTVRNEPMRDAVRGERPAHTVERPQTPSSRR